MEHFGIRAEWFSLYEAIKKEAEKIGWRYCTQHVDFHEVATGYCDSLYFSTDWNEPGDCRFSFSNSGDIEIYKLPEQWDAAIWALKKRFENCVDQVPKSFAVSMKEIAEWKGVPIEQIQVTV